MRAAPCSRAPSRSQVAGTAAVAYAAHAMARPAPSSLVLLALTAGATVGGCSADEPPIMVMEAGVEDAPPPLESYRSTESPSTESPAVSLGGSSTDTASSGSSSPDGSFTPSAAAPDSGVDAP